MDENEDAERNIMKCYEIIKMQILQIKKLAKRGDLKKNWNDAVKVGKWRNIKLFFTSAPTKLLSIIIL